MALKKKVIFTVTNDLTYDQRMQKICRSLSAAGYEVELVGRQRKFSAPLTNESFKQTRLTCIFDKGKLFYLEYNLRLLFYLLKQNFDAVCAIDLDTLVPAYFATKIGAKHKKLFYDAHEYFTEVPEVSRRKTVKAVWEWVEKTFVPKVDMAYTVSPAIANLFTQKYGKRFGVIMNVPVLKPGVEKAKSAEATILYQGALNEGRGLEYLIEAMANIDARLILAGEGDLSNELRTLATRLNLGSKIEFLGFVKPAELIALTAKATVGVNLLENKGLSYYYSLSNKFFDYIHARLPQVCINFPEYKAINDEFGVALLVNDCNSEEIKKAIDRLINDAELYSLLQKKCEVCSLQLNWQQEEKKLLAFYNEQLR